MGRDSLLGIKKGKNCEKLSKTYKNTFFSGEFLSSWKQFARITSESLVLLFFKEIDSDLLTVASSKERSERLAYSSLFLKSHESELLTVAL